MRTVQRNHGLIVLKTRHNAPETVIGGLTVPEYDDDALLTKKQLATALNTSERTIQRWIAAGTAPPVIRLPSGGLRWRWGTVKRWLVEQGDRPPDPPCRGS